MEVRDAVHLGGWAGLLKGVQTHEDSALKLGPPMSWGQEKTRCHRRGSWLGEGQAEPSWSKRRRQP